MWDLYKTAEFTKWLDKLDKKKFDEIAELVFTLQELINPLRFIHSKALGKGLFELKERDFGLRVYYTFLNKNVIVLLKGGDKNSQQQDIIKKRVI
jgi:putative addiction module killer protein